MLINNKTQNDKDYKNYIEMVHNKREVPNAVLEEIVKKSNSSSIVLKERIISGEVNEVYLINTSNNDDLIVRISFDKNLNFSYEKWAIENAKNVCVPVPEILFIGKISIKGELYSFCVNRYINGDPLDMELIDFNKISKQKPKKYLFEAGKILSKIHSVRTNGYGKIDGNGWSDEKSTDNFFKIWENNRLIENLAAKIDLSPKTVELAGKNILKFKNIYKKHWLVLNHGDFTPRHMIVRDGKIAGIIDWGEARSDSPVYDFANFDFWMDNQNCLDWLKEGYADKFIFDNNFENLLNIAKLTVGLDVLSFYTIQNRTSVIKRAKEKIIRSLSYFQ